MRETMSRLLVLACGVWPVCCLVPPAAAQSGAPTAQSSQTLMIENASPLPETYPGARYEVYFRARGGVPPLHWRAENGALPPGITLQDNGLLHGQIGRVGDFQFTAVVTDSGQPQVTVKKLFVIHVHSALVLNWKSPARVNGNRIEGSAEVTNTTPDNIDLTFIVLAVPENGRATAIGYQHFVLPAGTTKKELPFGETLPRGGYVVHVDAIGEVEAKNLIYRERMATPRPLTVAVE